MPTPCTLLALLALLPGPGKPTTPGPVSARPAPVSGAPELYLSRPRLLVERLNDHRVRLLWNAVPETNTQGYQVERSPDADHWQLHAYVPVNPAHRYRFEDTCRAAVYYRVVRLDFSRRLVASPPVRSTPAIPLGPLVALPNPARGTVRLLNRDPSLSVDLLDAFGGLVTQINAATFTTTVLLPGVYALRQGRQITRFTVR